MHTSSEHRKSRFRAALALAGETQRSFAEGAGVTPGHLSQVLTGERSSASLTEKVDAFIAKHLPPRARRTSAEAVA